MTNPVERYVKEMHAKFGYFANWMPNEPLELGDVGRLNGKLFRRETSLANLGIAFEAREEGRPADWEHSSGSGLHVDFKAAGRVAEGGGGAVINFDEEGAFLFVVKHAAVRAIDDIADLGQSVLRAHAEDRWNPQWVLVDTVIEVKRATILISCSARSQIELSAKAPLKALSSLTDARAGLSVTAESGEVTRILAASGLRPLFRVSRIKRAFLIGNAEWSPVIRSAYPLEEVDFARQPDGDWTDAR